MNKRRAFGISAMLGLAFASCTGVAKGPLVDPSAVRFPLFEAGTLEIEGTVVGQPRARDGIVYFATREGCLTAVVVPARQVFWRFRADHPISASPELGESRVVLRDDGNIVYVIDLRGSLLLRKQLDETVTTAVRESSGNVYFGTAEGKIRAFDFASGGTNLWEYQAAAAITAGPVFAGNFVLFGAADGHLLAFDLAGKLDWEFKAEGAVSVDPAAGNGRLYFGSEDRYFYCLDAATGRKKWSRRLQGAPRHPALIHSRRIALAASNSVIYFLAGRGGSILSWEAVPSRVVHDIAAAGPQILIAGGGASLTAFDFATGKRLGEHLASSPLAAGALWVSPFIVLVVGDEESRRQRLVFLGPQPVGASAAAAGSVLTAFRIIVDSIPAVGLS